MSKRAITMATLLALAVSVAGPGTAAASSLLSGYGGPGQGNQEILGSALLPASSGGGGGGGSSSSQGSVAPEAAVSEHGAPAPSAIEKSAAGGSESGGRAHRAGRSGSASSPASRSSKRHTETPAAKLPPAADIGSQALGLSGADVLEMLLALAALAVTATLTARLTRRPR
jgi:hypothetical protein